jgi:hypothetical protein
LPDKTKLPYLLKLLDDDSEEVQKAVLKELKAFGPDLDKELAELYHSNISSDLKPAESLDALKERVRKFLKNSPNLQIKEAWSSWLSIKDEKKKLEAAFELIAMFQFGNTKKGLLGNLLDELAAEYRVQIGAPESQDLSYFLFKTKGLKGADADYYNPSNSNLLYVLQQKKGIPISLVCIYILVGARLDLDIQGCNFPGHFLAQVWVDQEIFLVDCFNGGVFLNQDEIEQAESEAGNQIKELIAHPPDANTIISRVLNNLVLAYQQTGDSANSQLMVEILQILQKS